MEVAVLVAEPYRMHLNQVLLPLLRQTVANLVLVRAEGRAEAVIYDPTRNEWTLLERN